ncbi:hypothetical protein SARC_04891 [Sphaeroforma arctica JP610]|uniref:Uncharacterized protein n=1 Tax=Sphaeroforma arctica JP610 TaxID=667725 RepID=A0A0L0G1X8_9EUKA|nr:hypothetical protein SARC_04891 [Sphaeroforma arctica JP610]KNC82844.1 hypothetical protein SARC_04891 [Sphaeroforma arctica JP610]|eukprot:XP_014156746.1 hypothetical protein SARC_04891 [Sphaeroforma arctica JP610]
MTPDNSPSQILTSTHPVQSLRQRALQVLVQSIATIDNLNMLTKELADELLSDLSKTTTVDSGLARLLASEHIPITNIRIVDANAVVGVSMLRNLTKLNASHTRLLDRHLDTLRPLASTLTSLDISHCAEITYRGVVKLTMFTQLEALFLEHMNNILTSPEHLVPLERLVNLRTLSVAGNTELRRLPATQFSKLAHLQHLNVSHTKIDFKEVIRVLRKAKGNAGGGEIVPVPKRERDIVDTSVGTESSKVHGTKRARFDQSVDTHSHTQSPERAKAPSILHKSPGKSTHVPVVHSSVATQPVQPMPISEIHIDTPVLKKNSIGHTLRYFPYLRTLFLNQPKLKELQLHFSKGCNRLRILGLSNWNPRPIEAPAAAEGEAEAADNVVSDNNAEATQPEVDRPQPEVSPSQPQVGRERSSAITGITNGNSSARGRNSTIPGVEGSSRNGQEIRVNDASNVSAVRNSDIEAGVSRVGSPEIVEEEVEDPIEQEFSLPHTIHTLVLHKCTIENKVLVEILRANPALRRLKVIHNPVVTKDLHELVSRIVNKLSLETLVLHGCYEVFAGEDEAVVYQRCTDDVLEESTVSADSVKWTEFR